MCQRCSRHHQDHYSLAQFERRYYQHLLVFTYLLFHPSRISYPRLSLIMSAKWMKGKWFGHSSEGAPDSREKSGHIGLLSQDDEESIDSSPKDYGLLYQRSRCPSLLCTATVIVVAACVGFIIGFIIFNPKEPYGCEPCYVTDEKCSQHMSASCTFQIFLPNHGN
jgi:hypothetical protein